MVKAQQKLAEPSVLVAGAALFAAAVVGVLLAYDTVFGIAALFALLYVPLAMVNLPLAVAMWVPLIFLEGLPGGAMLPDAGAIVVVGAWIGVAVRRDSWQRQQLRQMRGQIIAVVALLAWLMLSIVWAQDPGVSATLWVSWVIVAALFLVVATAISSPAHLRLIMWAFVGGSVASIVIGMAMQFAGMSGVEVEGRFQAGAGDPNYLGAQVAGAFALTFGLLATTREPLSRLVLLTFLAPLTYGLVASQSRGALIAVAAMVVLSLALFARQRAKVLVVTLISLSLLSLVVAATPGATERIFSSDDRGSGRTDIWTVGTRMVQDNPVVGVGLDNFGIRAREYTREPGQLENVLHIHRGQEAHNLYLGLFAETGPLGMLLFMLVAGISLYSALRAARIFELAGQYELGILARSVMVGLAGMLTASFFLPNGTDKRMWVLLGLASAALGVASYLYGERTRHSEGSA